MTVLGFRFGMGNHFLGESLRRTGPSSLQIPKYHPSFPLVVFKTKREGRKPVNYRTAKGRAGRVEHHLWMKRDSAGSGQKALNLVRIVTKLPNEKDAIYGALDKWSAWETEFPLIAAAKALGIMKKRKQWLHIIQVTMWLLSKGQCMTMGTYDTLLLAFDMEGRIEEAESIWNNLILHTNTRSVSKRLFARMMAMYDHHHMPEKLLDVFADMEELGVKPDEDSVRRIGKAFMLLGEIDKQKQVQKRYGMKWKFIHFNGERIRVKTEHH